MTQAVDPVLSRTGAVPTNRRRFSFILGFCYSRLVPLFAGALFCPAGNKLEHADYNTTNNFRPRCKRNRGLRGQPSLREATCPPRRRANLVQLVGLLRAERRTLWVVMRQLEGSRTTGATGLHLLSAYLAGSQTGSFSRATWRAEPFRTIGFGRFRSHLFVCQTGMFSRPRVGFSE